MAKIYGLFGSITGKLADTVMSVRNGEQIARKYQPVVFNPSTPAQVANRAKLKLMSQVSAVMAPYIAIRREGNVSSRNLFVKANYPLATYADNAADITLSGVTLTRGVVSLPYPELTRGTGNIAISLTGAAEGRDLGIDRVVYVAFERSENNHLRFLDSKVVSEAGSQGSYPTTILESENEVIVYAYGVRDNTENAHTVFGNMTIQTAAMVANLIVSRTIGESDVTLTETRANTLAAVQAQHAIAPDMRKKK